MFSTFILSIYYYLISTLTLTAPSPIVIIPTLVTSLTLPISLSRASLTYTTILSPSPIFYLLPTTPIIRPA